MRIAADRPLVRYPTLKPPAPEPGTPVPAGVATGPRAAARNGHPRKGDPGRSSRSTHTECPRQLVGASTGAGVCVWDLDPLHRVTAACAVAGRNLTRDECFTYIGSCHDTCPNEWHHGVSHDPVGRLRNLVSSAERMVWPPRWAHPRGASKVSCCPCVATSIGRRPEFRRLVRCPSWRSR